MKLTGLLFLSLDGVYQGPGALDEDTRKGFERGGWLASYGHRDVWGHIVSICERADALLLGRQTWDIRSAYWPHHDAGDPVSHGINVLPKHVSVTVPSVWATLAPAVSISPPPNAHTPAAFASRTTAGAASERRPAGPPRGTSSRHR